MLAYMPPSRRRRPPGAFGGPTSARLSRPPAFLWPPPCCCCDGPPRSRRARLLRTARRPRRLPSTLRSTGSTWNEPHSAASGYWRRTPPRSGPDRAATGDPRFPEDRLPEEIVMDKGRRVRSGIVGLAAGLCLALLIWPGTRWLVRNQFALLAPQPANLASVVTLASNNSPVQEARDRGLHRAAERFPNDVEMQIADALIAPGGVEKAARLRRLETRFPDSPALYASALRFDTQGPVMVHRPEESELSGRPDNRRVEPSAPEVVARFDQDADAGERL